MIPGSGGAGGRGGGGNGSGGSSGGLGGCGSGTSPMLMRFPCWCGPQTSVGRRTVAFGMSVFRRARGLARRGARLHDEDPLIFAGSASPRLAAAICRELRVEVGASEVIRFSEGTLFVRVLENVRGRSVYLVQSTVFPTNANFMELLFWIDAFSRAIDRLSRECELHGVALLDRRLLACERRRGHGGRSLLQLRQGGQE